MIKVSLTALKMLISRLINPTIQLQHRTINRLYIMCVEKSEQWLNLDFYIKTKCSNKTLQHIQFQYDFLMHFSLHSILLHIHSKWVMFHLEDWICQSVATHSTSLRISVHIVQNAEKDKSWNYATVYFNQTISHIAPLNYKYLLTKVSVEKCDPRWKKPEISW